MSTAEFKAKGKPGGRPTPGFLSRSQRIVREMRYFMEQTSLMKYAKELKGDYKGLFRFRVGDYRAIFTKDGKGRITILTIICIKHRKDIYE